MNHGDGSSRTTCARRDPRPANDCGSSSWRTSGRCARTVASSPSAPTMRWCSVWKRLSADEKRRATAEHLLPHRRGAPHQQRVPRGRTGVSTTTRERQAIVDDATKLGNIVRYVLRVERADREAAPHDGHLLPRRPKTIISKAFRQQFAHYYLPWDEYYETLGIEDLRFDFLEYDKDPVEMVLETIRQEPDEPSSGHHPAAHEALPHHQDPRSPSRRVAADLPEREVLDLVVPGNPGTAIRRCCSESPDRVSRRGRMPPVRRGHGLGTLQPPAQYRRRRSQPYAGRAAFLPTAPQTSRPRSRSSSETTSLGSLPSWRGRTTTNSLQPLQRRPGLHRHPGGTDADRHSLEDRRARPGPGSGSRCRKRTGTSTTR